MRLLAREAANSNDFYAEAIYYNNLINEYPNSEHELVALYNLFVYYIIERMILHKQKTTLTEC